jgi:hypothetical protein
VSDGRLLLGLFALRHRFDDDALQFRVQSLDQLVDGDSSPRTVILAHVRLTILPSFSSPPARAGAWSPVVAVDEG